MAGTLEIQPIGGGSIWTTTSPDLFIFSSFSASAKEPAGAGQWDARRRDATGDETGGREARGAAGRGRARYEWGGGAGGIDTEYS